MANTRNVTKLCDSVIHQRSGRNVEEQGLRAVEAGGGLESDDVKVCMYLEFKLSMY